MSHTIRRITLTTITALTVVAAAACASPTAPTTSAVNSSLHSSSQVTPSDGVLVGSGN